MNFLIQKIIFKAMKLKKENTFWKLQIASLKNYMNFCVHVSNKRFQMNFQMQLLEWMSEKNNRFNILND